jgi:F0F1-type ATP synthase beta subunit
MTQSEVLSAVQSSITSVTAAYWDATDPTIKTTLASLQTDLDALSTKLAQEDLESRTEDFSAAADTLSHKVLPEIKALQEHIASIVKVDSTVQSALTDLVKLSSATGFFGIPI